MQIVYIPSRKKQTLFKYKHIDKRMGVIIAAILLTNTNVLSGGCYNQKNSLCNILLEIYRLYVIGSIPTDKFHIEALYSYMIKI